MAEDQKRQTITANKQTGGATVTVASKMPFDLMLKVCKFVKQHEMVVGGGQREVTQAYPNPAYPTYVVRGNSYAQNVGPGTRQIIEGYTLTNGIPKDFWDEWVEQHKEADYVVNHMIFAHADSASAIADANDHKHLKSGLERLDPKNLPTGLQTSDEVRRAA